MNYFKKLEQQNERGYSVEEEITVTTCGHELGCCNDEYKLDEVELYVRTDDGFVRI